jgi:hypothetical protein
MDDLLQKLRMGDVHRASKGRARQAHVGRLQRQSLSSASSSAMPSPRDAVASMTAESSLASGANDPGDQARGLLAQITGKDGVRIILLAQHGFLWLNTLTCLQPLTSPTSPQFRVKRERRALKPLFPSNAADILSKSEETAPNSEESARSPEAVIAEAGEGEEDDQDAASVSGSDYSHEDDGESDADDGRSNFGLDSDDVDKARDSLYVPNGSRHPEEDEDGDVTMRMRELSRTPSAETPNKPKMETSPSSGRREKTSKPKKETTQEEDYLSELSEDEAFAASLA